MGCSLSGEGRRGWGGKLGKYCQRQKCQGQRVGRKGAAKRAALSREQSVSQQSGFYIYILQSTVMPWRLQQKKPLHSNPVCVLSIRQQGLITSWHRNSLQKADVMLFFSFLNILHVISLLLLFFFKESSGNLHALKGLNTPSNFFHLLDLIHHLSICELVSLSYQAYSFVWSRSSQGLLNPAENFLLQKMFPSPGGWLSLTPTAVSPFGWGLFPPYWPLHGEHGEQSRNDTCTAAAEPQHQENDCKMINTCY